MRQVFSGAGSVGVSWGFLGLLGGSWGFLGVVGAFGMALGEFNSIPIQVMLRASRFRLGASKFRLQASGFRWIHILLISSRSISQRRP